MSFFKADFSYYPTDVNLLNAPVQVEFTNSSIINKASNEDTFTYAVDNQNNVYTPTLPLNSYLIFNIDKNIWDFGDKTFSNDINAIKKFEFPGIYVVKLSVYSNEIYDEITGVFFRIVNVKTIDLKIESTILTWLKLHMIAPHKEAIETSQAFKDLFASSSKMYDRMLKEINDVANLMDVKTVAPKFLEFFSDTLNHKRFYAKKIGYATQIENENKQDFLNYDIFERITKGIAEEPEILLFRQFIVDTASYFKQNGSKYGMEAFFKLYEFIIHVKELWTTNFEQTSDNVLKDDFFLDSSLENTKSKFKFKGLSIVGWDNSVSKIGGSFNNLLIDNYHFISTIAYPGDVIFSDACSQKFEIHDYNPNIKEIFRADGRPLTNKLACPALDIISSCTSSTSAVIDNGIKIEKNENWSGVNKILLNNIKYKFWNAPKSYVKSIITTLGTLPTDPNEIAENGDAGDTNDDYLWGDWNYGVTIPPGYTGLNKDSLRKPSLITNLPFINYNTTSTNNNLIQIQDFPIPTTNDFFIVARGFIEVPKDAYYVFGIETGNPNDSTDIASQQIALFSLKHTKTYTSQEINQLPNMDDITFIRDNTDVITTIGPTGNENSFNLYSKKGEYGIIELRQNQNYENSGYYYLKAGIYAFEIKATYSSLNSKKLKLYWDAYVAHVADTTITFENIISKRIIPKENYITINETTSEIEDTLGKGYLTLSNALIEGGDLIDVMYTQSTKENNIISGIISTDKKYKDSQIDVKFVSNSINEFEQVNNRILPQKTLYVVFRANYKNIDLYANLDNYYAVCLDGRKGSLSLQKIVYSKEIEGPVIQKLNLNQNLQQLDKQIYDITILDENGYTFELEDDIFYDLSVIVKNNTVTVKYRKNTEFTNLVTNLFDESQKDIINFTNTTEYTTLIENINLDQADKDIKTFDFNDNPISVSDIYEPIDDSGYYGLAVKSSLFKINEFKVTPFDKIDENLVSNENKWQTIKPKYLDSKNRKNLKYGSNEDDTSLPLYNIEIANGVSEETNVISLNQNINDVTENVVNSITVNNLDISNWGTRFNIIFNKDFLNNRFKNVEDAIDSLTIPFGHFYEPYINWMQADYDNNAYQNSVQGGYTPNINENAQILPHTIAISGGQKIYISELNRTIDNTLKLTVKEPLFTLLNSTNLSKYNGVWEEVCPYSSSAIWGITGTNSITTINNEVFEPIYKNKNTKEEIIGVKVVTDDILTQLICEYCVDTVIWGLYEIILPEYTIENFQNYDNILTKSIINPIKYFVPIGKLNKEQVIYLPPPELLRNSVAIINLKGVYVNLSTEKISLQNNTTILLNKLNAWESKYKSKIKCNYYLDIETKFFGKLSQYEKNNLDFEINPDPCDNVQEPKNIKSEDVCNSIPNTYYMPKEIISLLNYIQTNSTDFENDFNWWNPNTVWLKRKFSISYPENSDLTVFSGLNSPNTFFTKDEQIITEQGSYVSLDDGFFADSGKYILDASWCVSSVGWESEYATKTRNAYDIGIFDATTYLNIGFDETSKSKMGYERNIPIGLNLNAPLPLQTISVSGQTLLHFGDYLNSETGSGKTISPYGLYNWMFSHANPVNDTTSDNPRSGWSLSEMNELFVNSFKFNNVYGQVNSTYFKINNYWAFYKETIPSENSIIKIKEVYSNSSTENDMTIGVSNGLNAFYSIPSKYLYYPNWNTYVSKVFCDNYTLPSDLYFMRLNSTTNEIEFVLNKQQTIFDFNKLVGDTKIILNVFSDTFNKQNLEKYTISDNFKNVREINWFNLLNTDNVYEIAKRLPDTELKYTTNSYPYAIIEFKGENCYQLVNKFDYTNENSFNGTNENTSNEVGIKGNNGSIDIINLIDKASTNFSLSCDVAFDKNIYDKEYDKKFELILKSRNDFIEDKFGMTDFYFVGIGTYNFDIGLGMRSIDKNTGEIKETYLASYGDFNVKNIKVDTFYTVRAELTDNYINVYFNEKGQEEELVLHYNIDKKYEKLTERYLKGEFETLQSIITGLQELTITYPNELGNTVSSEYVFNNFKEELAKTLPINGYYSGFRVFNPYTYVSNIKFDYFTPKQYKYGFTTDCTSFNDIIENIKRLFALPANPEIKKIQQARNYTVFILINDSLYYQHANNAPELYKNAVDNFYIIEDKIFIIEKIVPSNSGVGLNKWAVGDHSIVWSLTSNTYNIQKLSDFFKYIPNLTKVTLNRTGNSPVVLDINDINNVNYNLIELTLDQLRVMNINNFNNLTLDKRLNLVSLTIDALMNMTLEQLSTLYIVEGINIENYTLEQVYLLIMEKLIKTYMVEDVNLELNDSITFTIGGSRTITWPLDGTLGIYDIILRIYQEGFTREYPILIKDKTFYNDELRTYMEFSNKKINKILINDNKLNLIFKDI